MEIEKENIAPLVFTIVLGSMKVISATGQLIFGINQTLDLTGNSDHHLRVAIVTIGALSTAYVRAFTRYPALWKQLSYNDKVKTENKKVWPESKTRRTIVSLVALTGVLAGIVVSSQALLGTAVMLDLVGVDPNSQGTKIAGVFFALAALVVYYAFFIKKTMLNAISLLDDYQRLRTAEESLCNTENAWNVFKTNFVSLLGTAAFSAFAYFTTISLCATYLPHLSNAGATALASIALATTFLSNLLSRIAETHKFMADQVKPIYFTDVMQGEASNCNKFALTGHFIMSLLDVATYSFAYYSGMVNTLGDMGADARSNGIIIGSVFPILSLGLMHYIYSVRPILVKTTNWCISASEKTDNTKPTPTATTPLLTSINQDRVYTSSGVSGAKVI